MIYNPRPYAGTNARRNEAVRSWSRVVGGLLLILALWALIIVFMAISDNGPSGTVMSGREMGKAAGVNP